MVMSKFDKLLESWNLQVHALYGPKYVDTLMIAARLQKPFQKRGGCCWRGDGFIWL